MKRLYRTLNCSTHGETEFELVKPRTENAPWETYLCVECVKQKSNDFVAEAYVSVPRSVEAIKVNVVV